jgi:hypothetical protein
MKPKKTKCEISGCKEYATSFIESKFVCLEHYHRIKNGNELKAPYYLNENNKKTFNKKYGIKNKVCIVCGKDFSISGLGNRRRNCITCSPPCSKIYAIVSSYVYNKINKYGKK